MHSYINLGYLIMSLNNLAPAQFSNWEYLRSNSLPPPFHSVLQDVQLLWFPWIHEAWFAFWAFAHSLPSSLNTLPLLPVPLPYFCLCPSFPCKSPSCPRAGVSIPKMFSHFALSLLDLFCLCLFTCSYPSWGSKVTDYVWPIHHHVSEFSTVSSTE